MKKVWSVIYSKKFPKAKQCGFSIFYSQDHYKKFIPGFDSYLTLLTLLIRSLVAEQPHLWTRFLLSDWVWLKSKKKKQKKKQTKTKQKKQKKTECNSPCNYIFLSIAKSYILSSLRLEVLHQYIVRLGLFPPVLKQIHA